MAKSSRGKRPCCICRKWFTPDVRQKKRQVTCGRTDCMDEQHRRQCEKWNKKNRAYFKNNYLGKKIEQIEEELPERFPPSTDAQKAPPLQCLAKPVLPCEILTNEYGAKNLIIIQYLTYQILNQAQNTSAGLHRKLD